MAPLLECPLLALSGHHAPKHKTSAMGHKADISRSQHTRPLMTAIDPNYGEMLALEIRALLILILLASSRPKS